MAQRVRDILLRIRGDASDAQQDLQNIAQDLRKFDGTTATATVDVNTTPAERKVAAVKKSVQDVGRMAEQAKVDLQTTAAETKLKQLRQNLERLQARPTEPKIDIAIGRTVAQIEKVEAQLDRLDRRRVDIDVDVDRHGRGAGRLGGLAVAGATAAVAGVGAAAQGLGLFVSAASRGIPIIGGLGQLFIQLGISGAALGPIFLILVPIIGIFLLNAVVMLSGALFALGASFLTAAAGVGVLGVALAGAFGPVVLVAIAAMARFAKVLEAVKAAEEGTAQGAQRATTALQAQKVAAEQVDDAIRGIAQAELSREQASLGVEQAELALKQFRQEAGLTSDSLDGLFTKFTDISFRPESLIKAIQKSEVGQQTTPGDQLQLQQLILNLRSARLSEQAAIDGVSDAHERLAEARQTDTEALEEQDKKIEGLTGTEQKLVDVLVTLKKTLTDAFRPATQKIFEGVIAFLGDLSDFAKDSRVRGGLTSIGSAIGGMFKEFGRVLRNRETREAFGELARGGARLIRQLTPVFTGLFRLVLRVADVALPWLEKVIGNVGKAIRNWVGDIDRSDIENFVRRVRRSFNIWVGIARELWGILKALFGGANKDGDKFAEHLRTILRRWRRWLEDNPDAIRNFFKKAVDFANELADQLPTIVSSLETIAGLAQDIKDIINTIQWPAKKLGEVVFGSGEEEAPSQSTVNRTILLANNPNASAQVRREARRTLRVWGIPGYQRGGLIRGMGLGDRIPILAEPGEFMLKRSVAQAIGIGRLNLLNAGNLAAIGGGGRGIRIENQTVVLPAAPGHDQMGDVRHQAAMFARELRRRGDQGLAGGGFP